MIGVYQILNLVNGKFYIGSSVNIQRRFSTHRTLLRLGEHPNKYLQNAWNKYGENSFRFIILEEVKDLSLLRDRETYYLQSTNCTNHNIGYNLLNDANIGLGVKASEEVRQKISEACTGSLNGNYGRKHTAEEKRRMRDNRWGKDYVKKEVNRRVSPERLAESHKIRSEKMREWWKTHTITHTEDGLEKLRQIARNRTFTEQTREKMSQHTRGMRNPNSKLTPDQVKEIYIKMNSGVNYKDVCKEYGIGQCWAYKIKKGDHWALKYDA